MLLFDHTLKERLAIDQCNMNCMVRKEDVVDALTMVDEKGQKALLEPTIFKHMVVIFLNNRSFITATTIAHEHVDVVTFGQAKR